MARILSIDPAGNYKEGRGISGICVMEDREPKELSEIKASNFSSDVAYWDKHVELIELSFPDQVVIEGYRLYNHRGMAASSQANSELETPQLIGAIKLRCFQFQIPLHVQFASEVKSRWSDQVLVKLGILEQRGRRLYFDGKMTNDHQRDALRHALHYRRYNYEG